MSKAPSRDRRARRAAKARLLAWEAPAPLMGLDDGSTPLHEERLRAVLEVLLDSGAATVVDLGCGGGALLKRLVRRKEFATIVGVDASHEALRTAEQWRASTPEAEGRLTLIHGSFADADERLRGFDAATLVEVIEHIDPKRLSAVERAVFAEMRPSLVVLTTPNRDYNACLGIHGTALRHDDHRFEWGRAKFRSWASGVAARNGYAVSFEEVGPADLRCGSPTQMGIFRWSHRAPSGDGQAPCAQAEKPLNGW